MNKLQMSLCVLLMAGFAGCATHSPVVVDQSVGPDLAPPRIDLNHGRGRLVVYSALEVANPVNSDFPTHAGYEIYGLDGKLLQRVDNRDGSFYQTPATVSLAPGEYKIKAPAPNMGLVTVPVIIKENKTTTLDLEGSHLPQHKPTGAGQWVRLPDGAVIGMRVE
jgi:hypothetical protein